MHLKAVDVRCFSGFLDCHSKLNDVQKELKKILVLAVTSLNRKCEKGFAVFGGECWSQSYTRPLARLNYIKWILGFVGYETLRALAETNSRSAGDHRRHPPAAWRYRDDPAFFVGCLN